MRKRASEQQPGQHTKNLAAVLLKHALDNLGGQGLVTAAVDSDAFGARNIGQPRKPENIMMRTTDDLLRQATPEESRQTTTPAQATATRPKLVTAGTDG
jgi:hypothetical protein